MTAPARAPGAGPAGLAGGRFTSVALLLTPILTALGFFSGSRALLPILSAAPGYALLLHHVLRGRRRAAIAATLLWAALLGATSTCLTASLPVRASAVVIHGPAYWEEMSPWLETGRGRESDPVRFVPQHLLHAAIFAALSLATASSLSILFGAILMNYMAYYAAQVALSAPAHPIAAGLLAWCPWALVRIVSFVVLGTCLAEPVLSRLRGRPFRLRSLTRPVALAAAGLLLDIVLKTLLAPHWHALLRSFR